VSAPLFLVDDLPAGPSYTLTGPEGHHAATVQRLRAGEALILADGRGGAATAEVTAVGKGAVEVRVTAREHLPAADPRLVVAQGIAKGDRGELAVQAMTEVGVDEIVPWAASRCVTQWKPERREKSLGRWRSTAREAAKQARRAWLPQVAELATTAQVAERISAASRALILHEEASAPLSAVEPPPDGEIIMVVGPEGGISDEEIARFTEAGARPVLLGPTVLRTSTAGVAAASVLLAATGRW